MQKYGIFDVIGSFSAMMKFGVIWVIFSVVFLVCVFPCGVGFSLPRKLGVSLRDSEVSRYARVEFLAARELFFLRCAQGFIPHFVRSGNSASRV